MKQHNNELIPPVTLSKTNQNSTKLEILHLLFRAFIINNRVPTGRHTGIYNSKNLNFINYNFNNRNTFLSYK